MIGNLNKTPRGLYGSGGRLILKIRPDQSRLSGFQLGTKGLILVRLDQALHSQSDEPLSATVGIDFGTSNTCLSTLAGHGNAEVLVPTATTTSFLNGFADGQREESHEGYAADFDFFSLEPGKPGGLFEGSFFPTQLASRTPFEPADFSAAATGFDPLLALICFESVSDLFRMGTVKVNTVVNYAPKDGPNKKFEASVHLKDRLKWDADNDTDTKFFRNLRRIFLQHLRLQLIHSTAKTGAWIAEVRASYPRAFTETKRRFYEADLDSIWCNPNLASPKLKVFTESHAAAAFLKTQAKVDHFLIDIGGGTTDICVFADGQMGIESSVRIAADVIDRFFLAKNSRVLREVFLDAYREIHTNAIDLELKTALVARFPDAYTSDSEFEGAMVPRGLFYAILKQSESLGKNQGLIYSQLSEAKVFENLAVEKFHTTLAVFYGGLSYFAGLMLRKKVEDDQMRGRIVQISFAGNGANHLSWLRHDNETAVDEFLGTMFRAGSVLPGQVTSKVDILIDPKASVALGLVNNDIDAKNNSGIGVSVYDHVDGDWPSGSCRTLSELYATEDPSRGWEFGKSEICKFLASLAKATPEGKIGGRRITSHSGETWASALVADEKTKNSLGQAVGDRLSVCRKSFAEDINARTVGLALEPVFIAELSGLLSIFRNA